MIIPIILSGGAGTRLWPLSCNDHPKQFLKLNSDKTMIQETLLRLKGLDLGSPIISCNHSHRFLVAQQIGEILDKVYTNPSDKKPLIILEPSPKNTAPAIAASCYAALEQDKNAVVLVLPSDHVIKDLDLFHKAIKNAVKQAEQGNLITFGIVPTYPATGYGYIKSGKEIFSNNDNSENYDRIFSLEKFVEKPCLAKAQEYLDSGEYFWNSGMFVFKASVYLQELKTYNPEIAELCKESYNNALIDKDFIRLDEKNFDKIKGNSIDYVVMEKTKKGAIVKLNAGWSDVGSWAALYDISKKDNNLNVIKGDVLTLDTTSSYICGGKRTIATIGLDNIVIIDSDDSLLISTKGKIQDVKKIVEEIKKRQNNS